MNSMWEKLVFSFPYVLPVLGGGAGIAYVNLNPGDFLNPVFGIGIGVFLGWAITGVILHFLNRDR